jgi:hypothetical protein
MDFHEFDRCWGQDVSRSLASCGALWHPLAPDWIPLPLRFRILEACGVLSVYRCCFRFWIPLPLRFIGLSGVLSVCYRCFIGLSMLFSVLWVCCRLKPLCVSITFFEIHVNKLYMFYRLFYTCFIHVLYNFYRFIGVLSGFSAR